MYYIFVVRAICVLIVCILKRFIFSLFSPAIVMISPYHPVDLIIVTYIETVGNIVLHPFSS